MHSAFTEETRQEALEIAYSGMAQFSQRRSRHGQHRHRYGRPNLMDGFNPPPASQDPFLKAITSGGSGGLCRFPSPPATFRRLRRARPRRRATSPSTICSTTFRIQPPTSPGSPRDRSAGGLDPHGSRLYSGRHRDRHLPRHPQVGGVQGHAAVVLRRLLRRPIFITGDPSFPSQIDGDVYTLSQGNTPDIGIGRDAAGATTSGSRIRGEAITVDAAASGVQVVAGTR